MQEKFKQLNAAFDAAAEKASGFYDQTCNIYERTTITTKSVQDEPETADTWDQNQHRATVLMDDAHEVTERILAMRTKMAELTEKLFALDRRARKLSKIFRPVVPTEATHSAEFYTFEDGVERTHTVYAMFVTTKDQCEVHGFRTEIQESFLEVLEEWVDGVQVDHREDYEVEWVEIDDR